MWHDLFQSLFTTGTTAIGLSDFLICLAAALVSGIFLGWSHAASGGSSRSFVVTVSILPAVVCMVIMMVNGNMGTGVAVAGAFSLVRFRSAPGSAREIGCIFIAMAAGLMMGMGYLAYGAMFTLLICLTTAALDRLGIGSRRAELSKTMTVTIPEDLNYSHVFDDLLEDYTSFHRITRVRTTDMGSLFKITYDLRLKSPEMEKYLIDGIRVRNGNLEITVSPMQSVSNEL